MSVTDVKPITSSISSIVQFYFTLFFAVSVVFSAETRTSNYYQVEYPHVGLNNPIGSSEKTTMISCADKCSSQSQCRSFLWDSNGSCTTGSWPKAKVDMMPSGSMKLFTQPSNCRFDLGYEIRPYGTTEKCVNLSPEPANYQKSRERCRRLGGRLLKTNSKALIRFMLDIGKENGGIGSFWGGIDDIDRENLFIWSDGQALTLTEKREFFARGQPDGDGDCVEVVEINTRYNMNWDDQMNDLPCFIMRYSICEMDI